MTTARETEDLEALRFMGNRAEGLVRFIRSRNRKEKKLARWRELQITTFLRIVSDTATDLTVAYSNMRIATVAWLTRNLLELSVWIEYCTSSERNGRVFLDDALMDIFGMAISMDGIDLLKYTSTKDFLINAVQHVYDPTDGSKEIESIEKEFRDMDIRLTHHTPRGCVLPAGFSLPG